MLQPILVRIVDRGFEVVAGHRRLEACRRLHWVRMPCLVRDLSEKDAYEIGLVENVQRQTLSPVEEAKAFRTYASDKGWGGVKQLAEKIGKSEGYVSHRIALLRLPSVVLELIESDELSPSTGQELLWLGDRKGQIAVAEAIAGKKMPAKKVREAVMLAKSGRDVDEAISSVFLDEDSSIPWESTKRRVEKNRFVKLTEKSVLTLRICVVRLDSIIEELDQEGNENMLRQVLLEKRIQIHNHIDDLLRLKRSIPSWA